MGSHLLSIGAYNSFVKDSYDRNGDEVAILVEKSISVSFVHIPDFVRLECIGVTLKLRDGNNLTAISLYCLKGDVDPTEIDFLLYFFNNLCIMGDDSNCGKVLGQAIPVVHL